MKLSLMLVGETDDAELKGAIERYVKRLKHYCTFETEVLKSPKHFKKLSHNELKVAEGKLILESLSAQDFLVLLDERGVEFDSVGFSKKLQNQKPNATKLHLNEPIRWAKNDPLEAFVFSSCLLNAGLPKYPESKLITAQEQPTRNSG